MIDPRFMKQALVLLAFSVSIIALAILMPACGSNPMQVKVHTYAGDSERGGITRMQDNKTLSCTDPAFDQFVCMDYEDLRQIYIKMQSCKEWGEVPSAQTREGREKQLPGTLSSVEVKPHPPRPRGGL